MFESISTSSGTVLRDLRFIFLLTFNPIKKINFHTFRENLKKKSLEDLAQDEKTTDESDTYRRKKNTEESDI